MEVGIKWEVWLCCTLASSLVEIKPARRPCLSLIQTPGNAKWEIRTTVDTGDTAVAPDYQLVILGF